MHWLFLIDRKWLFLFDSTWLIQPDANTHNKSYKNGAIEKGDCIYLNGVRYSQTSELENYKISNVVICTSDSGRKLYEIEEYPDYEYIAGYCTWDGEIYKKDETD